MDRAFNQNYNATIGISFQTKHVFHNEVDIKLVIWDTSGAEKYKSITDGYMRGSHGFIIMYDVCDEGSFTKAAMWVHETLQHGRAEATRVLVANKRDLDCAMEGVSCT